MGHTASITATLLCHCSWKTAIDTMQMNGRGCVPLDLINTGGGPDGHLGCSLLTFEADQVF